MQYLAKLLKILFKIADPDGLRQLQGLNRLQRHYTLHLILFLGCPEDVIMHVEFFLGRPELNDQLTVIDLD